MLRELQTQETSRSSGRPAPVELDGSCLTLEQVRDVARHGAAVRVSADPAVRARIDASLELKRRLLTRGTPVYGVTTGVGDSVDEQVAADRVGALQESLVRKCGCGSGPRLPDDQTRAAILIRANCFVKGHSGVRPLLIDRLLDLLNLDLLPSIPEQGSVGASGDLVPGSYIAAALLGERTLRSAAGEVPAAEAWARVGREPVELEAKEGLALINGTMIMAGIGSLALLDAERLALAADVGTAMTCEALRALADPFAEFLQTVKPHPGVEKSAGRVRRLLEGSELARSYDEAVGELEPMPASGRRRLPVRLQANYSVRCASHCVGALYDTVDWGRRWLETEINSSNDNPLFEAPDGKVHSGGNFSGFHVGLAMDALKTAVASVADQTDRQLALLVDEKFNNGLPRNLAVPRTRADPEAGVHHGFKAVQFAASALAAEALQRSTPMSLFSRSTESHNQDKVSMATIAARQARDVIEMAERCCAMHLLACCQAADLLGAERLGRTKVVYDRIRAVSSCVERDRELDGDIARAAELLRTDSLLEGLVS